MTLFRAPMVQAEGVPVSACSPRRRIGADDHWHLASMPRAGPGHPLVHGTGADNDPTPTEQSAAHLTSNGSVGKALACVDEHQMSLFN
jgi:hypothetical protein